jgi:hypothetical protein
MAAGNQVLSETVVQLTLERCTHPERRKSFSLDLDYLTNVLGSQWPK